MSYRVVDEDGTEIWYSDGKIHREDGPAVTYSSGTKEWWLNDEYHREDGPAIEWTDGTKEWYLFGKVVHVKDVKGLKKALELALIEKIQES